MVNIEGFLYRASALPRLQNKFKSEKLHIGRRTEKWQKPVNSLARVEIIRPTLEIKLKRLTLTNRDPRTKSVSDLFNKPITI